MGGQKTNGFGDIEGRSTTQRDYGIATRGAICFGAVQNILLRGIGIDLRKNFRRWGQLADAFEYGRARETGIGDEECFPNIALLQLIGKPVDCAGAEDNGGGK